MKGKAKVQAPLGTIAEEAELCRKAFAKSKVGDPVQHCHHDLWLEFLDEPAENRIQYILLSKTQSERAARLRMFRPLSKAAIKSFPAEWKKAYAEWQKADAEWQKADAQRQKAYAEWEKAYAEWQKADAERQKADAEWEKADAEWQKANAEPLVLAIHAQICGCPWSKTTDIFGRSR